MGNREIRSIWISFQDQLATLIRAVGEVWSCGSCSFSAETENAPVAPPKYVLTDETIVKGDMILYRIQACRDIDSMNVKTGDFGGFVQSEHNLSHHGDAWVGKNALVGENALVIDNAWVGGDAWVSGDVLVSDDAVVSGNAVIRGDAVVVGNAVVSGDAWVSENAVICGKAVVSGDAVVRGG